MYVRDAAIDPKWTPLTDKSKICNDGQNISAFS